MNKNEKIRIRNSRDLNNERLLVWYSEVQYSNGGLNTGQIQFGILIAFKYLTIQGSDKF